MQLPAGEHAVIEAIKIRDYLLSPKHPVGRSKARFFASLGFSREAWAELESVFVEFARSGNAEYAERTPFGQKYTIHGTIKGPNGRTAGVVTAWIILDGELVPRFITAFPGGPQ